MRDCRAPANQSRLIWSCRWSEETLGRTVHNFLYTPSSRSHSATDGFVNAARTIDVLYCALHDFRCRA